MRILKPVAVAVMLLAAAFPSPAQRQQAPKESKSFSLGKWTEINGAILKELNRSYVDSLPLDRIEKAGIDAMLESLDPYTVYVPADENEDFEMMISRTYGGIGAIIYKPDKDGNVIITEPYAGSPAARAGLVCGDEIMAIDGVTTHGIDNKEASERMKGKPGTVVTFKVKKLRSGEITDVRIMRERIHIPDLKYAGILDDGKTGYALLSGFTEGVSSELAAKVSELKARGMEKFILDLRGNGGGLLSEAVGTVSVFVPKGSLVVSSRGASESDRAEYRTTTEPVDTALPVVILVDSGSASSSEIVAGALQDLDRATIMGTRTFGKGLVQSIRPLPYGGQLKVTTAKYYTPSGRCVQAIDYSRRNEDGSVGHIPDSLTKEFRTAGGRIVRDGGGITPDVTLTPRNYSRLTYSLVMNGITDQYALEYVRAHETIPPVEEFRLTDDDYEEFILFASAKEFDYRSSAKTLFDQMVEALRKDGLEEDMKPLTDALQNRLEMDKETFLRLKKAEIIPFLEEAIVVRYHFQEAGVKIQIRYDELLREALTKPLI